MQTPNAGLLGGSRKMVLEFLYTLCSYISKNRAILIDDAAPFLYVILTFFKDRLEYGLHINSKMKTYGKYNPQNAWWAHK